MLCHELQPLLFQLPLPCTYVPGTPHFPKDAPGSLPGPWAVSCIGHCSTPAPFAPGVGLNQAGLGLS